MHPMAQTDRHTDGHGDSFTESAQWGVSENLPIWQTETVSTYTF